jgi:hypothetical protein
LRIVLLPEKQLNPEAVEFFRQRKEDILYRFAFPTNAARLKLPLTLVGRQRF